ncbi:arginine--tRNA ligase [Candidatus Liberibacter americanus]|uniref:Arginine--tRNA ligase n=1 Tax=Candidatus Liberibacter americanus str. Sao Paulo TaxID=1261131 RepID=U6B5G8_9HYPH|nr:arginine--tRNA ligase [Candidatus Liberibacter americanus]AHA28210.1 Arginyl-tRNA synthetase [Candidatus Liberibacter americanus str. Sao Paulo]EMS36276.1 arginyl-tRNA synthetase [Candidatus Liberibacter americanus PW_SP]
MHLFTDFSFRIRKYIKDIDFNVTIDEIYLDRIIVERPRDVAHGHLTTNAAMILSRPLGLSPIAISELIAERIRMDSDVDSVFVAGKGFINLYLSTFYLEKNLSSIIMAGIDYGRLSIGKGKKVNIEYVSANPTGPMHVGHCRCAVVGDVLANLMSFSGYEVTREYYINDAGAQIDILARSVFLRYKQALENDDFDLPEGFYPGSYLKPIGKDLVAKYGSELLNLSDEEWLPKIRDYSVRAMMDIIKSDLRYLNIRHDIFVSEKEFHDDNASSIKSIISDLTHAGYVYKGTLPPPKSRTVNDLENERPQILFRSTIVGDDVDRPLLKSDGSYTYFAADLAYFKYKYKRGFNDIIYVLGSDHSGYVKRLEAIAAAVSDNKADIKVILCELVRLYSDGVPIKMSKRAGDFITLRYVVDEVGCDSVRFMMLWRKNSELLDFDFYKIREQSRDNPVFYVQYAYARCRSIFRQAKYFFDDVDFDSFKSNKIPRGFHWEASELQLIVKLLEYPRIIENATVLQEPHKLAFYLYDLASLFHSHWSHGKKSPELRFIKENDRELTMVRLQLAYAVALVINSGLDIIGVASPNEMS